MPKLQFRQREAALATESCRSGSCPFRANTLRYITQVKARPPTFALWLSQPAELPDSYQRYLVNGLRDPFALQGVPVRLLLRGSKNPYAEE